MPRAKKVIPVLPTSVFSLLGPWAVTEHKHIEAAGSQLPTDATGASGMCDFHARTIQIDNHFSPVGKLQVLGHEIAHVWSYDGGLDSVLTEQQQELVCDAFGTWFAAAMKIGYIVLDPTKAE